MKILHVIQALGGGGAERQLLYLTQGLQHHELHVAYVEDRGYAEHYSKHVRLHALRSRSNFSMLTLCEVRKLIQSIEPDVVQTWTPKFDVIVGVIRGFMKFSWVIREASSYVGESLNLKARIRIALAHNALCVVSNSPAGDDFWRALSLPTKLIPNGYDSDYIKAARSFLMPTSSTDQIVFIGRLSLTKNVEFLLEVFSLIEPSKFQLTIIGEGPDEGRLQEIARKRGIKDVRFLGALSHVEALAELSRSRALVLPSLKEGVPNVVLEAMLLRVPAFISDTPSHRKVFPEEVVSYFPLDDASALANQLASLLSAPPRFVDRAADFGSQWTLSRMASSYDLLYRRIHAMGRI